MLNSLVLKKLEGKHGTSVMADRGFTIKDMLNDIGVELNIPPFLEGRPQLPQDDVRKTRHIASLRIHVKRAIGQIKVCHIAGEFSFIKQTR